MLRLDFDELLIFNLKIAVAAPAAPAVAGVTPLLDFHERHLERQPRVWEDSREVNQFVEDVKQLPALWAQAPAGDPAPLSLAVNQQLADDDRFHHANAMLFQQLTDFVA